MYTVKKFITCCMLGSLLLVGCKSWNKTQKGAVIGTAAGAGAGAVIGRASGNTAMGAIIGAAVGGGAGAIIGHKMDKQAQEIKSNVKGVKVERVGEGIVVEFNNKILFGFDRSDLTAEAKTGLSDLVTVLNQYPDTNIEIQGHTDSKGTDSYNEKLSKRRADAVADYLSNRGIRSGRLTRRGYGEDVPKYDNSSADGQAQNRRVEFLIAANEKMQAEAKKESGN
ncbi:MAG: OmpA family protein [Phycisphaerae bacterium]|nr:OmpA family protein [Saprospiraceae bacterium]